MLSGLLLLPAAFIVVLSWLVSFIVLVVNGLNVHGSGLLLEFLLKLAELGAFSSGE